MAMTLRRLFRNYISLIGAIIAGLSFLVNVVLLVLDFLSPTQNPYLGIVTYMILPGITLSGMGLVFAGAALHFFRFAAGPWWWSFPSWTSVTPGTATPCSGRS